MLKYVVLTHKHLSKVYKLNARRHCLCTVGELVHTLPEGGLVWGVTLLTGELYLVRRKGRDQVEVYNIINFRLLRRLTVPDIGSVTDMTSCSHYNCVYIGDVNGKCVHRLDAQGAFTRWTVSDAPEGLSVNTSHNVIVACSFVRKIKEFSSHGDLLWEITLPSSFIHLRHAIQTHSGQFIVCHGNYGDPVHRVCMIRADGRRIVHSHGGQRGSDTGQYNGPVRLAVDDNEFVFVVDVLNRRVTLLSPTLEYVRQVISHNELKWEPNRVYLDTQQRRLYVAVHESIDNEYKGRVAVFSV